MPQTPNNRWEELWLAAPSDLSEDIGAQLYYHEALSIEIRTASFPTIELPEIENLLSPPPAKPGQDWLIAAFAPETSHAEITQAAREALLEFGLPLENFEHTITSRQDDEWQERWKKYFKPIELACLRVLPVWEPTEQQPEKMTIRIDPGMAFGTGQHTTTTLCLNELSQIFANEKKTVNQLLDFGCGSGILSIAAAMYGVQDIDGVDNDSPSIENAQKNIRLNEVDSAINLFCPALPDGEKEYELIVANILAPILIEYADHLCSRLTSKAVLILSGVLNEERDEVLKVYQEKFTTHQLRVKDEQIRQENEWSLLRFELSRI